MTVIGLTGGIASGKTTVGRFFRELGIPVIDADDLSREAVEPGTEGFKQVVDRFGEQYLRADGSLDRPKLGLHVFQDPASLKDLEDIVHPLIRELSAVRIEEAADSAPYVIYDAALHVEAGTYKRMDKLIVISVSPELQLKRLMKRNKLERQDALNRIEAQLPLSYKLEVADYVILNDNNKEALKERTLNVHHKILDDVYDD